MPVQTIETQPASPAVKSIDSAEAARAERAVTGLFDFMATLESDSTFRYMRELFHKHSDLALNYQRLADAHDLNMARHTDAQRCLKEEADRHAEKDSELDRVKREKSEANRKIASLERQLQESEKNVSQLRTTVRNKDGQIDALNKSLDKKKSLVSAADAEEKKARKDLKACQKELISAKKEKEATETKLVNLRSFTTDMTDTPHETIAADLDTIFNSAFDLVHQHFRVDLDEAVLNKHDPWKLLLSHPLIEHTIPLPKTNTPAAKSMRGSAVLAVLASSLVQHVFQPTYLLEPSRSAGLSALMLALARTDPERESHLRSVLLSIDPVRQKDEAARRVGNVVDKVALHAEPLLSPEGVASFRTGLEAVCAAAGELWVRVQRWAVKVDVSVERKPDDEVECWRLLPLLQTLSGVNGGGSGGSPRQNGNGNGSGGSSSSSSGGAQSTPAQGRASPDPGLDPRVVWPSFFAIQDGEFELLRAGFVLGEAQVKAAQGERSTAGSTTGSRRGSRQIARRSRQLTLPGTDGNGASSFLSQGVGVGIGSGGD